MEREREREREILQSRKCAFHLSESQLGTSCRPSPDPTRQPASQPTNQPTCTTFPLLFCAANRSVRCRESKSKRAGGMTYQIGDVDHLNGVVDDVSSRGIWPLVELDYRERGERMNKRRTTTTIHSDMTDFKALDCMHVLPVCQANSAKVPSA